MLQGEDRARNGYGKEMGVMQGWDGIGVGIDRS